jgi:hypothetical protein
MNVPVDADVLVYRAAFATEYPKYSVVYGEDGDYVKEFQYKKEATAFMKEIPDGELMVTTIVEPAKNALHIIDSMLGGIAYHFGIPTHELDVILSGDSNFRNDVAVTRPYKAGRKPKPVHYKVLREHLLSKYGARVAEGEEADDMVAYTHYESWMFDPDNTCIVTIDKDLDMIPGLHYNPVTEEQYHVDEDEADKAFLRQLISGDDTDNIPGIPGMAKVKAKNYLEANPELSDIADLYMRFYGDKAREVMDEQGKLLWIRRFPEEDWKDYWKLSWEKIEWPEKQAQTHS